MNSTNRRKFIGTAAFGTAAALSNAAPQADNQHSLKDSSKTQRYDVVVFGGGPAGIVAAAQAARAGASTLLIEKNGLLGGTTTSAGVNFPGLFHAWGKPIIAGIGWELVNRCVETTSGTLPDFSTTPDRHWMHQVRVDRAVYAALADELVVTSGADVLFHAMPATLEENADGVDAQLCTKTGLRPIHAKIAIDCTGDANALSLAGCNLVRHEKLQPGTLMLRLSAYDLAAIDKSALKTACETALKNKELLPQDLGAGTNTPWRVLATRGDNALDIIGVDGRTSEGRSAAELAARAAFLRLYRFLRCQPGLENLRVDFMANECGIRETVTIEGQDTVTVDDYTSGRLWPEATCYSFYPIDWHRADGAGINQQPLKPGTVATIPRGALLPTGHHRLIAAGRIIASDQLANSALRVQATCMAVGQVAGVLSALSVRTNTTPAELLLNTIKKLLREHNAIVPSEA